jgi:succinate-semialdehyde dehydrogenase/glutarate-semialdehyde dehydrogenase
MYQSINPYSEEVLQTFEEHSARNLEDLLAQSHSAFTSDWSKRSIDDRAGVIAKASKILLNRRDAFARIATLEMGKLFVEAQREVELCVEILAYYAQNAHAMLAPRSINVAEGDARVETAALGIIFCIEPWNFPYYQLARVAGPNLMAGNTVIVKHAPSVPQCALAFEQLFLDAGAPAGAYTNVFISNEQAATVIADRRVKGVALTGSERAGSAVASEAGALLKKSTMELGGSDAFMVFADADLDLAVKLGVSGRMMNSGQVCDGSKRFILHNSIAEVFIDRFQAAVEKLVPGNPLDEATTLAPLCSEPALNNALTQINAAVQAGAKIAFGGKRIGSTGYFLEPTGLLDVSPDNPAYYQEFFCPVAQFFRFETEEEAIDLANDSRYGLGGTIISKDVDRAKHLASQMETGMVFINAPAASAPNLPFGGVKNSGYGRELSDLGINEFVNKKLIRAK